MFQLALGTLDGVAVFAGDPGGWRERYRVLDGEDIVTVRFFPDDTDSFLAGSYGRGLFRVRERGKRVEKLGLNVDYLRTVAFAPGDPAIIFAGAEPAELFRSGDRGDTWASLNIRRLPPAATWSLPYSPRGGALRSLILPATDPFLILAGVEQGGFLRSRDGGSTWHLENQTVDKDVHSLSISRENSLRIFAATGDGVFRSMDQGEHWKRLTEEYTRGVAVAPDDPQTIFAGPAGDVGERGWIVVSRDGGNFWEKKMNGLPDDPIEDMVQNFYVWEELPDTVMAVLSGGRLFTSGTKEVHWWQILSEIEGIQTLALIRDQP